MKVIICGAGRVGYGIAERLSEEGNDVSVIDVPRLRVIDTVAVGQQPSMVLVSPV